MKKTAATTDAKPTYEQLEAKVSDLEFCLKGVQQLLASERAESYLAQQRGKGVVEAFRKALYDSYLRDIQDKDAHGAMAYSVKMDMEFPATSNAPQNQWIRTA